MTVFLVFFILAFALIAPIFWGIGKYNSFVSLRAMTQEAWSGIDVQLKRRYDLIPNLVETVKHYQIHEKGVLENIAKFRSASMHATTVQEKSAAEGALTGALKTLFAVAENYPELKANENFLALQNSLEKIEDELQISRRYYNGTARNYNIAVMHFPARIVASFTSFAPITYFELDNPEEKTAPRVQF
ncbi:TPA: hypothetical protein DCW54_02735 [Candidatus Dependentiae bacterium]|nr:hypothetical protein [Candidatus Dependentiae bacterium]